MSAHTSRCRSWRATPEPEHVPACLPGSCRRCWRPCSVRVPEGVVRCDECLVAIATHPSATIRGLAAVDEQMPSDALRDLAKDPDFAVSRAAEETLAARGEPIHVQVELDDLEQEDDSW